MKMLLLFCVSLTPVYGQSAKTSQEPLFSVKDNGALSICLPRPFLELEEVRKQLETGLTNSFAISLLARNHKGPNLRGYCRIDIRFEPWDQIYFLTLLQYNGRAIKTTLASFDELVTWFAGYHTSLVQLLPAHSVWTLETTIDLLPFSEREAERTQRWFNQSVGNQSDEKRDPNKVLDLLVTSSIRSKPLSRYTFKKEFEPL